MAIGPALGSLAFAFGREMPGLMAAALADGKTVIHNAAQEPEIEDLAELLNKNTNVSIDVGQIMFGQTVTASGDTMRQHAQSGLADPRKWIGADISQ